MERMNKKILQKVLCVLSVLALAAAPVSAEEPENTEPPVVQSEPQTEPDTDPAQEPAAVSEDAQPEEPDDPEENVPDPEDPDPVTYTYELILKGFDDPLTEEDTEDTSVTFELPDPEPQNGRIFLGWSESEDDETPVGAYFTLTSDHPRATLYPLWENIEYTITYVTEAGTLQPAKYTVEDKITLEKPAERPGWDFRHWTVTGPDGNWETGSTFKKDVPDPMYGNVTLTAVWELSEYEITFDTDNHLIGYTIENPVTLDAAEKDGYEFLGWKVDKADEGNWLEFYGKDTLLAADETLTAGLWGDVKLSAQWEAVPYIIVYDTDGAESLPDTEYAIEDSLNLPIPEKTGYTFLGWVLTESDGNWEDYLKDTAADYIEVKADAPLTGLWGDITLTAVWKSTDYTIDFDMGEDAPLAPIIYSIAEYAEIDLPVPEKNGYEFLGWTAAYDDSDCSWPKEIPADEVPEGNLYGNVLLTPIWKEREVIITYIAAGIGGKVSHSEETTGAVTGEPYVDSIPDPGYTLDGWYMDEACEIPAEGEIIGSRFTPAKDTETGFFTYAVYYAKFKVQSGELTFSADKPEEDRTSAVQSLIFDVEGWPNAAEFDKKLKLTVVLPAGETERICELPVGEYTVTERNSWSWRYQETDSIDVIVTADGITVPVTMEAVPEKPDKNTETEPEELPEDDMVTSAEEDDEDDVPLSSFVLVPETDLWLSWPMYLDMDIEKKKED